MTEVTVQLPDDVAASATRWLSVVVSLNMHEFETPAAAVVNEISRFLLGGPTTADVLNFKVSSTAQARLQRLLDLNKANLLGEEEQSELDELEQIEHMMRMIKLQLYEQIGKG